jgi:ATP-binding cassette subfamily F protein 3
MILGQESVDEGEVILHPGTRLGYLEQNEVIPPEETVIQYLERISGKETWECAKMVGAFEIKKERLHMPVQSLSGGYQMRVKLAGVLVRDPNLLLLDEPTNYLDLQTILLLEEVLKHYRGALLLISHDREFLKNVCDHTWALEQKKFFLFSGDIEAYFAYKEEKLEEAKRYNKKVQAQQAHLQDFVDRFRYKASKATQAQSKLKQLAKLKTIEIAHRLRTVRIQIPCSPQKKALALECRELSVGYDTAKPILKGINIEIERGDHVAIVGENGQGKSTFLRTLAGELEALSGTIKWGHRLRTAYYAQHVQNMLPREGTAGMYLRALAPDVLEEALLRMAGNFLFSPDDLDKTMQMLSGGERARLCLAGICLGTYDILILDEPTNHLDFDTVEALGEALSEYEGTIFFVSHGRTFASQVATSILEIKDGRARRYPYPYDIYVHELKTHEEIMMAEREKEPIVEGEMPYVRCKTDVYHDIQTEKRTLKRLEQEIVELGQEKKRILEQFATDPLTDQAKRGKRLKEIEVRVVEAEYEWFAAHDTLEAFECELRTAKDEAG